MGKTLINFCKYLLLPEDTTCQGFQCLKLLYHSRFAQAGKTFLWVGMAVGAGIGLGTFC